MKLEIKQRIEQIKAGQVPDGYKRTRAGIMPYDWCCDREYRAKDIFKSITNKKHNGEFDVLSATQDKGVIPREQVDINIKYNKDSVAGYKKVDKGDFVISLRSFQGGIESSEYEGLVSPAYTVLKPIIPICDKYYKYYFKTSDYINRLNIGTYGIRDGKQIGYEDFGDMVIHYPPLAEQEKIAKILSAQDRIIELYQRKIEELQKMKKVYLSKMFPKKGENVPEWRFPQFTDPWEQRELGKVSKITIGEFVIKTKQKDESPYPVYNGGVSYTGFYDDFNNEGNKIIVSARGANAGFVNIVKTRYWAGNSCYSIDLVDKNNYDTDFVYQEMKRNQSQFIDNQQAANIPSVSKADVEKFEIVVPAFEEQRKIAECFVNLDNLITLHQRKLEETKKYKKALMQLLLTGIVRCE